MWTPGRCRRAGLILWRLPIHLPMRPWPMRRSPCCLRGAGRATVTAPLSLRQRARCENSWPGAWTTVTRDSARARDQGALLLWRRGAKPPLCWIFPSGPCAQPRIGDARRSAPLVPLDQRRGRGGPLLPAGGHLPFAVAQDAPPLQGWQQPQPRRMRQPPRRLRAVRGWLSSDVGLWLTLTADNDRVWMGDTVAPANALQLTVRAGVELRRPAACHPLAKWRCAGRRQCAKRCAVVTNAACPSRRVWFHATVSRADGAFAISVPIHVESSRQPTACAQWCG